MATPQSKHLLAAWTRHPLWFAIAITLLGGLSFGASLLMPVGLPAVALAAAGAVASVTGLLTALILLLASITGLRSRSERVVRQGRASIVFPGGRQSPQPATPAASPQAPNVPPSAPTATSAAVPIEDQPTQPLVIDLTQDTRQPSTSR